MAGIVAGSFSPGLVAARFVYSAVAAAAIGLAFGLVARYLMRWLPTATLQNGLSLLVPFVSYEVADRLDTGADPEAADAVLRRLDLRSLRNQR